MTALAAMPTAPQPARASGLFVNTLPAWLASAADIEGELAGVEVFGGKLGRVIMQLERDRVDFFFPRELVTKHYPGGRQEYHRAFIPRCFFVGQGADGRDAIREYTSFMGWRVNFLRTTGNASQAQLRKEVTDLGSLLHHDPSLRAWQGLKGNDKCRIVQGPFQGFEGYIEREGKDHTFYIHTTIFGRSTPMQVPVEYLERI